jgi:hypothetical protein
MKALLIIQNIERFLFKRISPGTAENGEEKSNEHQDESSNGTSNGSMDPFYKQLVTLVRYQVLFYFEIQIIC